MKTLAFVALLAAMFLAASPAYAQVHKCKDVAGKTIYSDAPCAVGTRGRQINVQPNTIDTRMDWERSERYIRSRQQENELRRPSAAQPSAPEQQANEKRDSYACKMAIRNAETRIVEIKALRKKFENEAEFYKKKAMPAEIQKGLADTEFEVKAQESIIESKKKDMVTIQAKYDDDRKRFLDLQHRRAVKPQ